ncbi:MAG: class I SAM-dependent methyltransferase, partial [Chloroflexota bacterium]|nr:class I SAM-dependent methyltransferase [Chloroflexota bacterium]
VYPDRAPYALDVATGTGRLPIAMLRHAQFEGPLFAVDASLPMLRIAAEHLRDQAGVMLLHADAERLPFADDAFDVVTCLEALEFMMHPPHVLAELVRVLRPGGWLLITHRRTARWMPGKVPSPDALREQLAALGLTRVRFDAWQVDYDRVWAHKPAAPAPER